MVLCLCVLWVWITCVDDMSMYLYSVLGEYLHILVAPSVQSCGTLSISASYRVFVYGRYHKSRLVVVGLLDIARFYEELCQPSGLAGDARGRTICTAVCQTPETAPHRVGSVVWSDIITSTLSKTPLIVHLNVLTALNDSIHILDLNLKVSIISLKLCSICLVRLY